MRPLRYSINVTLDGCCDHEAIEPDAEMHQRAADTLARADALLFGRVTYQLMEGAFRRPADPGPGPVDPFAQVIDAAPKHVVSSTLDRVDWNAQLLSGPLAEAVQELKDRPGRGLYVGGVQLPRALAELGLIDEYEIVVHPRVAGRGPTLFAGLASPLDLTLVDRVQLGSGAVGLHYVPRT